MGAFGSVCHRQGLKARFVASLGTKGLASGAGQEKAQPHKMYGTVVHCPEGHAMRAHVVREVFNLCSREVECEKCDESCGEEASHYLCTECDIAYCNHCARQELGLPALGERAPPVEVMPGDIFLCGPDKYGIHHVVLARSGWREADPEVAELLGLEPGVEILAIDTIESTQGSVGQETWWYPTTTFFMRNHENGTAVLVADLPPNSEELEMAMEPVPTKVMLHPFRHSSNGAPALDLEAFEQVVQRAAEKSVRYAKHTAVRSVIQSILHKEVIQASDYPTKDDRVKLLESIRQTWRKRPICASVAIQCWQQYFDKVCGSSEEAAQQILDYMPHWCHRSTPSAMVTTLTQHGWVLQDNFDAGA